jgi:hypothetical protein
MSFLFFWYFVAPILVLTALGVIWITGAGPLPQHSTLGIACLFVSVAYGIWAVIEVKRGRIRLRS